MSHHALCPVSVLFHSNVLLGCWLTCRLTCNMNGYIFNYLMWVTEAYGYLTGQCPDMLKAYGVVREERRTHTLLLSDR